MRLLTLLFVTLLGSAPTAYAEQYARYTEPYRPGFHYSPELNWTNEPNGLVYHNGVYHLSYQANPFSNQFGNQTWGHATSTDLVHWEQQPAIIEPENGVLSFSGSSVVDHNNSAGFGAGAIVAAYTGFIPTDGTQDQRLAYSNDGINFTKYASNPVIPRLPGVEGVETRDPKVFWHDETASWKMVLSHGGQKKLSLWTSSDLKSWFRTQDFRANDIAGSLGGYEVPDMFRLPVKDAMGAIVDEKWVLSMTPSGGSPAGGNGVNYFVGEFDGFTFTSENTPGAPLWADYGRDFDGQQSWSNSPDGRTVWTAIMQSYGESVPTTPWRGQMAFPRELSLLSTSEGPRLLQQPIAELQSLRGEATTLSNVTVSPGLDPLSGHSLEGDMLEISATFDPGDATTFGFRVRQGANGDVTSIGYNPAGERMFMDRRSSGDLSFAPGAGGIHFAPLQPDANGHVTLRALIDRNSVELFGGIGESVISNLIFPDPSSQGVSIYSTGGDAQLVSFEAYELSSIWTSGPEPVPGTRAIARWSMDAVPQAVGVPWSGLVSIDSRTRIGEGTELSTNGSPVEPDPAVDNLWSSINGGVMATSSDVPPPTMFTPDNDGGASSFNALANSANDGALHLPTDLYGNEAAFDGVFSIELFFRTEGEQSQAGLMQLLLQGDQSFRYGVIVNEGGAGNVRFAINDKSGQIPFVDMNSVSGKNYADGDWHYLLATYDPSSGTNGELSLTIASEDGTAATATTAINGQFQGLPSGGDGDLLIGRNNESLQSDPRVFRGLIDEVQLTSGIVPDLLRLGALPGDAILRGDFNQDGIVDSADYTVWRDSLGQAVGTPGAGADANANGIVEAEDYAIWEANYGLSHATLGHTQVPEPSGMCVLTAGMIAWLACLRVIRLPAPQTATGRPCSALESLYPPDLP